MKLNTNLRRLKRYPKGFFSLLAPKGIEALTQQSLCDSCGRRVDCSMRRSAAEWGHTKVYIVECAEFQVPIKFHSKAGTGGLRWNTIRLGPAWADRVKAGDRVALVDKFDIKYGAAEVLNVHCGERDAMIRFHARYNHLMLETPPAEAPEKLLKALQSSYGPLIVRNATEATVIYLKTL